MYVCRCICLCMAQFISLFYILASILKRKWSKAERALWKANGDVAGKYYSYGYYSVKSSRYHN